MLFHSFCFSIYYYFQIDVDPNVKGDVTVEIIWNDEPVGPPWGSQSIELGKEYIIFYRWDESFRISPAKDTRSNKWIDSDNYNHNPHACLPKGIYNSNSLTVSCGLIYTNHFDKIPIAKMFQILI